MTEGIYDISAYREPTFEDTLRAFESRMKELAEQSVLETNKGGNNGNHDTVA
jgi:hypothetical protein